MHKTYWHWGRHGHPHGLGYRGGFFFWPGLLLLSLLFFGALKLLWPLLLLGLLAAPFVFCSKGMWRRRWEHSGGWGEPEKRKNDDFFGGEQPKRKNDDTLYV